jgi:hypothetical protein
MLDELSILNNAAPWAAINRKPRVKMNFQSSFALSIRIIAAIRELFQTKLPFQINYRYRSKHLQVFPCDNSVTQGNVTLLPFCIRQDAAPAIART